MWKNLGIRFGFELMSARNQPLFELKIIFDDAVVCDIEAAGAVAVRMRAGFARSAVRRPAGVSDAAFHRAVGRIRSLDLFFQCSNSAHRPDDVGRTLVHDRDATGIVASILETFEAINQDARYFSGADVSNDSAHVTSRSLARR